MEPYLDRKLTYLPAIMSFNRVLGGGLLLATHVVPRGAGSPDSSSETSASEGAPFAERPDAPPIKRSPQTHRENGFTIRHDQNRALDLAVAVRDWRYGRTKSDIVERALDAIGYNATYVERFKSGS